MSPDKNHRSRCIFAEFLMPQSLGYICLATCFIKPFHIATAQKIPKALQASKCLTVQFLKFSRPQDTHNSVH